MSVDLPIPQTKVLAIASHVVYGYVGNTMAGFVMQYLGCDVAALNTVRGTKTTAEEITELYAGLRQSYLTDFDMCLTGYAPGAAAVLASCSIAQDLRSKALATNGPGSFFWVLDPVMGDQGRMYVPEEVLPAYKESVRHADLILPNQFEAELLSGTKITSFETLQIAIDTLHRTYGTPHIIVTSVTFDTQQSQSDAAKSQQTLSVVGSSIRTDGVSSRTFRIDVPAIDCFFSGTGDMFAALMVVRLREAALAANLLSRPSWLPADDKVAAADLPLAHAAEKALASMQRVLEKTKLARDAEIASLTHDPAMQHADESTWRLRRTKAAEVRLVRNAADLRDPVVVHRARAL